ncbi:MAG: hypothetical protein V8R80_05120 [Eubacterium sp.]
MEVTEKDLLANWKAFFSTGTNWKDWKPVLHMKDTVIFLKKTM